MQVVAYDIIDHYLKVKQATDISSWLVTTSQTSHPQCDGLVERFNRTLKHMLASSLKDHPFDWDDCLQKVCMAWPATPAYMRHLGTLPSIYYMDVKLDCQLI